MTLLTDLKLIDELLIDLKDARKLTLAELEYSTSVTYAAMQRLRAAWKSGEMPVITLAFAQYFETHP